MSRAAPYAPALPPPAGAADVLVLTRGEDLVESVRANAPGARTAVHHAGDTAQAERIMRDAAIGVVVTNALPSSLPRLLPRLRQWNPSLVVIAVGARGDADALMRLTAQGQVYRFLLQPLSPGQLSLYLEAALRSYSERIEQTIEAARHTRVEAREPRPARSALPFSLAAMIFLGSLSGFFLLNQQDQGTADTAATLPGLDADGQALARALVAAERAREERRFVDPPGDNAYYYYKQILAIAPHHVQAARGINELVNAMFVEADTALRDGRYEQARSALARARRMAPSHPRVGLIGSQIDGAEQRARMDAALAAAERADFARAQRLLAEASQGRLGETAALRDLRRRIRTLERDTARERAAATAAFDANLARGRLTSPVDDNAALQLARLERLGAPASEIAGRRQALGDALAARIAKTIADGAIDEAALMLAAYRDLGPGVTSEAVSVTLGRSLAAKRVASLESARLADLALARLEDGRLIEPVDDNARVYLAALLALPAPPANVATLQRRYLKALVARAQVHLARGDARGAAPLLEAAREMGESMPALVQAERRYAELTGATPEGTSEAGPLR